MSNSNGFTLIELIVTIFLIALFSSVIFISVSGNLIKSNESKFVNELFMLIKQAKGKAIADDKEIKICIVPETKEVKFLDKSLKIPETVTVREEDLLNLDNNYCYIFYGNGSSSGGTLNFEWDNIKKAHIKVERFFGRVFLDE